MGADKAYQHKLNRKLNHGHKSEIITFYVEHIMLVTDIINRIESLFHAVEIGPLRLPDFCSPIL